MTCDAEGTGHSLGRWGPFRQHTLLDRTASCPPAISMDRCMNAESGGRNHRNGSRAVANWPPSVDWVNQYGVVAVGLLAVPAAVATYLANQSGHGKVQKTWNENELTRRAKKLVELTARANDISTTWAHGSGKESLAVTEIVGETDQESKVKAEAGLCVAEPQQEPSAVRFHDLLDACRELAQMHAAHDALTSGLGRAVVALARELPEATIGTAEGTKQRFQDGAVLAELLRDYRRCQACVRSCCLPTQASIELHQHLAELRAPAIAGERALRALRKRDLGKALQLIWLAHEYLPHVIASGLLSAVVGVVRTAELYYRTRTLEVFREAAWTWTAFRQTSCALLLSRSVGLLMDIVRERVQDVGERGIANTLRVKMYQALLRKDFEWYRLGRKDQRNVDELLNEIYILPVDVQSFLSLPRQLVELFASVGSQVAIIKNRSSSLLYALVVIHWISSVLQAGLMSIKDHWVKRVQDANPKPEFSSFVEPLLPENLPTVRSFAAEEKAATSWQVYWENDAQIDQSVHAIRQAIQPLEQCLQELAGFFERGWCGKLCKAGWLRVEDMQQLATSAQEISHALKAVPGQIAGARDKLRPLARAWDLLELDPVIDHGDGWIPRDALGGIARARGDLAFEAVDFTYPGGDPLLYGVTFGVPAGTTLGLTGTSGSGKSTLFGLLKRFYHPTSGRITLDGVDIREYNQRWLRKQFAAVLQPPRILSCTLWENLTLGCTAEPTMAGVEDACRAAQVWDELVSDARRLPNGLYTHVTGEIFSGGELQRLAIARALLLDAPILLLDEATSALDSESQRRVQRALTRFARGRTVLTIAHRLETIRDADKIVCLHAGRIAEEGSHKSLVNHHVSARVDYANDSALQEDVNLGPTSSQERSGLVVLSVRRAGVAEGAGVRLGFNAVRLPGSESVVRMEFRGAGVYAELYKQQIEATLAVDVRGATSQAATTARVVSSRGEVLERLWRTREKLLAFQLPHDCAGTDPVLEQLRCALADACETLADLEKSDGNATRPATPKAPASRL